MTTKLLLATANGLTLCQYDGDSWRITTHTLKDQNVTSVIAREGVILAGTDDGIFRSDDNGATWREASNGLSIRHVRWLAYHPQISDLEFAGTEPAGIFVSHDGGGAWRECPEVAQLRDQHRWFLPYSPEAGCVRGFTFHGSRAYAAVEVGGALRSDDRGQSWRLVEGSTGSPNLEGPPEPFVYPDVHSIHVHPSSPDLVFAPTGGGFYRSEDGGKTWALLYDCYCRAVWADPADPAHLILGPAVGVDTNGRIEETRDGGQTWRPASDQLKVPWRRHMVERFAQAGDELLAVLSNGQLLASPLATLQWRQILPDVKDVQAVAEAGD
ncbi:MAG: WD40/YVTN/BNR-like repeat-containing protein [Anaerolineales bacterium]